MGIELHPKFLSNVLPAAPRSNCCQPLPKYLTGHFSHCTESHADLMSDYSAWRATYVGAQPTDECGLVDGSVGES